jgi:hypothetical protein
VITPPLTREEASRVLRWATMSSDAELAEMAHAALRRLRMPPMTPRLRKGTAHTKKPVPQPKLPRSVIAECRAFLHAAASRIEGAAFKFARGHEGETIADLDTLYVGGTPIAYRLGPNIVIEAPGQRSETLYPSDGVETLAAVLSRHVAATLRQEEVRCAQR